MQSPSKPRLNRASGEPGRLQGALHAWPRQLLLAGWLAVRLADVVSWQRSAVGPLSQETTQARPVSACLLGLPKVQHGAG